jgi:hypothetical protein
MVKLKNKEGAFLAFLGGYKELIERECLKWNDQKSSGAI